MEGHDALMLYVLFLLLARQQDSTVAYVIAHFFGAAAIIMPVAELL